MKTLTITDAKKNLGRWLGAAAQGEEIGIIIGAQIIALRPVEVEAIDYAAREYGVTDAELDSFDQRLAAEAEAWRRDGKLAPISKTQLKSKLEQATRSQPSVPKTARRAAQSRAR